MTHPGKLLILAIHRSAPWWTEVAANVGFEEVVVLTEQRGLGDADIVDPFYAQYKRRRGQPAYDLLSENEVDDVIARCRVLRWMPRAKATRMTLAMASVFDALLAADPPTAIATWPIDAYLPDVLARLAERRNIPFIEITASPIPDMTMLMLRGELLTRDAEPDEAQLEAAVKAVTDPMFVPSDVPRNAGFTRIRWLRIFAYFRARAVAFKLLGWRERDPLNIHFLDAQLWLKHKPKLTDIRYLSMMDKDWRVKLNAVPREKRLFVALQLFPEASIDYWIHERDLIEHDNVLVDVVAAFSRAGYSIFVKDHPLQFGFRRCDLIDRLKIIPSVVLVPYEVGGNALMALVGLSFTGTGGLGLQAALMGMKSIAARSYYYTSGDFVPLMSAADADQLPAAVAATPECADIHARQRRIVRHLLKGSFKADFMSFLRFDAANPNPAVAELGRAFGYEIAAQVAAAKAKA